jgi:mRNA-degrading endonuclease RelE of RelBE toxin-antitoxin system
VFTLRFSNKARKVYDSLKGPLLKQLQKTLKLLTDNPKHPSSQTHKHHELGCFEAYVQNDTPGAYRVFFDYGPEKNELTILLIVKHL